MVLGNLADTLARRVMPNLDARLRLDAGTFGTMGVGPGFAIAAAVALTDKLWVLIIGALARLIVPGTKGISVVMTILLGIAGAIAAVLSAVHHAEVVAHRVGEPFGTLVLALAVTVIEVALIVSMMLAGGRSVEGNRYIGEQQPKKEQA